MIVVGVALEAVNQMEAQLLQKNYDGIATAGRKLRGRQFAEE